MAIAIQTKYYGATNHTGSRIKAWTVNGHKLWSSYDHGALCPYREAAEALCTQQGWTGDMLAGATDDGVVFVFPGGITSSKTKG